MAEPVRLEQYKRAEREVAASEGRRGLLIHAWVTVLVVAGLVAINVFVASEFPWSIFPAIGMTIGVLFHFYGIRHIREDLTARQDIIERKATRLSA